MVVSVPYGDAVQKAFIPDSICVQTVDPPCKPVTVPAEDMIAKALDHPIGTKCLEDMVNPDQNIVIVVNDHTRPGPNAEIVRALIERLERGGVSDSHIAFLIATGTHRASTEKELIKILGENYYRRIRIIMHDCRDKKNLVYLGKTVYDMPVWVNRAVMESDFVITTGLIAPHHSAGFSGGRKSILPGVAGLETLRQHHSLPIRPFEPAMGFFEGNPFHIAALAAAKLVHVRFMINAVQDIHKQNVAFVAGDIEKAHKAGVEICREISTIQFDGLGDVVIASPGGTPRDCNLYQAQKALSVAETVAKKGDCSMILCARAEDGYGEGLFRQWMEEADTPEEVIERYKAEGFNVGNNKAFMFARALTKGRVIIVSENLKKEDLNHMMLEWAPDLQTAFEMACRDRMPSKVIVLPRAVNMIPKVIT